MSILTPLPDSSMVGKPFADYLNLSFPSDQSEAVRDSVLSVLDVIGSFQEVSPGLLQMYDIGVRKGEVVPVSRGTIKLGKRGKVCTVSVSGHPLQTLREKGYYSEFLQAMGSYPHRVTMLHATADYLCDSPPSVIQAVNAAASAGDLALTRKHLLPQQCRELMGTSRDGLRTGTAYLGQRANADVWAKVYDKQHEQWDRFGRETAPLVRVEVACMSDVGATLRDAHDPTAIFYHFAGRSLVQVPASFSGWSAHGEGFHLGVTRQRSLFDRFDQLVATSLDIRRVACMAVELYGREIAPQVLGRRLLALASSVGVASPQTPPERSE